jgi:hypothetical protein
MKLCAARWQIRSNFGFGEALCDQPVTGSGPKRRTMSAINASISGVGQAVLQHRPVNRVFNPAPYAMRLWNMTMMSSAACKN